MAENSIDYPPEIVPVDITNAMVTEVAERGGTDSVSSQHWLLHFGATSEELRLIVADFAECLDNRRPPWAAYQALMSGRLIALDKKTGAKPVGVRKTSRQLIEKCVLRVTGQEAKVACGTEQLANCVEAEIEGEINAMHLLWAHHSQEDN